MGSVSTSLDPLASVSMGWLSDHLRELITCDPSGLDAHLLQVLVNDALASTRAQFHCYCLALDGNRLPRVRDLARKAARKIVDYAIPRRERMRARDRVSQTGSLEAVSELEQKARRLFTSLSNTGEGGEVLLYLIAETYFRLPQLFCKMPLKTNPSVHVHGTDGLHAGVDSATGQLALYWGEAKMYAKVTEAVTAALDSLAPFLASSGGSGASQERDLQLLRDNLDLNNPELEDAVVKFLDPNHPLFRKVQYRGFALIAFDSSLYPATANATTEDVLRDEITAAIADWKAHISRRISANNLSSINMELVLLPLPAVDEFRKAFRSELGQP